MLNDGLASSTAVAGSVDVLVVDDDEDCRSELVASLDRSRISCMSAADGWSALRLLVEGCRPDLIVVDVRMPELSGLEFAEHLGKFYDAHRPKLVLISDHAGFDEVLAALRLGVLDFLPKPIDLLRLVRIIRTVQLDRVSARASTEMQVEVTTPPISVSPGDKIKRVLSENRNLRQLRGRYLSDSLFSEPSWEMLLELYHAELKGVSLSVTSLGGAVDIPMTTALRRVNELEQAGMVVKTPDYHDRRRAAVELSLHGRLAVEGFLKDYFEGH